MKLPESYKSQTVVDRKRQKTPDINDAIASSSNEDSNSVNNIKINNNADELSSSGWRKPLEYAITRQEILDNGVTRKTSAT